MADIFGERGSIILILSASDEGSEWKLSRASGDWDLSWSPNLFQIQEASYPQIAFYFRKVCKVSIRAQC